MTKTIVGYPDEPSRRAMLVATLAVGGAATYFGVKNRDKVVRVAVTAVSPIAIRFLALYLTTLGL